MTFTWKLSPAWHAASSTAFLPHSLILGPAFALIVGSYKLATSSGEQVRKIPQERVTLNGEEAQVSKEFISYTQHNIAQIHSDP